MAIPPAPRTLQVLHVAVQADAEPAHPFDLVAVWLAALAWVGDSRWRRLSGGAHMAALLDWLEALDLRVVALRLASPEDFGAESPGPCARRGCVHMRRCSPGLACVCLAGTCRATQLPAPSTTYSVYSVAPRCGRCRRQP